MRGAVRYLARDEEVFDTAEQHALRLRNFYDELRLCVGQVSFLRHNTFNRFGLLRTDMLIDVCDSAQDVGEAGQMARAIRLERVERIDNRTHTFDVAVLGLCGPAETEKLQQRHVSRHSTRGCRKG